MIDEVSIDHRIFDVLAKIVYGTIAIGLELGFTKIAYILCILIYNMQEKDNLVKVLEKPILCRHKKFSIPFQVGN